MTPAWRDRIDLLAGDAELALLARGARITFRMVIGDEALTIRIADGAVRSGASGTADLSLEAEGAVWNRLLASDPEPGWQSILACVLRGDVTLTGPERVFHQHLPLVRRVHELLRGDATRLPDPPPVPPLRGRYHRIEHSGYGTCDVFVERAGHGQPVLCVATAGSDSTQFHGLAARLPEGIELICVDLPWHGKSQPAWGHSGASYTLTEDEYLETLLRVSDALELDRPVLFGASMAGAAVVRAAIRHPRRFAAAIAAQTGVRVSGRTAGWFDSAEVNQNVAAAEWTYGLMAPSSPRVWRDRVWWGYTRGGYRTYPADIESYVTWDLSDELERIDGNLPPTILLGGAYDTTVPPEDVQALADRLPNAEFIAMPELGHFPHAEDPAVFAGYFREALRRTAPIQEEESTG